MCICRDVYICMCLFLSMYDDFIVVSPALICHYNSHSSVSYLFRNEVLHAPGFPQIHCIAKVNLQLMIFLPLLPCYVLGLHNICTSPTPGWNPGLYVWWASIVPAQHIPRRIWSVIIYQPCTYLFCPNTVFRIVDSYISLSPRF